MIAVVRDVADKVPGWHTAAMSVFRDQPRADTKVCEKQRLT